MNPFARAIELVKKAMGAVDGKYVRIGLQFDNGRETGEPAMGGITFELKDLEGNLIATSPSSKALSVAALDNGAKEVDHDYDLHLER